MSSKLVFGRRKFFLSFDVPTIFPEQFFKEENGSKSFFKSHMLSGGVPFHQKKIPFTYSPFACSVEECRSGVASASARLRVGGSDSLKALAFLPKVATFSCFSPPLESLRRHAARLLLVYGCCDIFLSSYQCLAKKGAERHQLCRFFAAENQGVGSSGNGRTGCSWRRARQYQLGDYVRRFAPGTRGANLSLSMPHRGNHFCSLDLVPKPWETDF